MVDWLMEELTDWITSGLTASLDMLLAVMGNTLLVVPDVTTIAQVRTLNAQMAGIANVCYLILVIAGFAIAMSHETVQSQYALKDIAPRLVFGAIAANLSLDWCGRLLVLGQDLLDAINAGMMSGVEPTLMVRAQVGAAVVENAFAASLLFLVLLGVIVFLWAALIFGWIARIGILIVLVAAAPLALACHALPQIDSIARLWWRTLLGTVGTQLVQTLVLLAGIAVFMTPSTAITAQMGITGGATINLLVLTVLLWCAVKVPGLMRRYVLHGGGNNLGGYIVRVLLVNQLANRILPRGGRRLAMRGGR